MEQLQAERLERMQLLEEEGQPGVAALQEAEEFEELLRLGFPVTADDAAHQSTVNEPRSRRGWFSRLRRSIRSRAHVSARAVLENDRGAVTAEYALIIMAAVAFAGLLIMILRSDEVRQMLLTLVQNALGSAG